MSDTPGMREFYAEVYRIVRLIPAGRVTTYGCIAYLAGKPMAPRAVGYALRNLPSDADVPWHRVVNAQGKISPRAPGLHPGEPNRQRRLLEREGVVFDDEGRLDLRGLGWSGSM